MDTNADDDLPMPQDDPDTEVAVTLVKAGLALIPGAAVVAELLSLVAVPILRRRQSEWYAQFGRAFRRLQEKMADLTPENLAQNEAFTSAFFRASQSALRTHEREKWDALRNGALNIAVGSTPDEDLQVMYMDVIDGLTSCHLQLLRFLYDPAIFGFFDKYYSCT